MRRSVGVREALKALLILARPILSAVGQVNARELATNSETERAARRTPDVVFGGL